MRCERGRRSVSSQPISAPIHRRLSVAGWLHLLFEESIWRLISLYSLCGVQLRGTSVGHFDDPHVLYSLLGSFAQTVVWACSPHTVRDSRHVAMERCMADLYPIQSIVPIGWGLPMPEPAITHVACILRHAGCWFSTGLCALAGLSGLGNLFGTHVH